MTARPTGIDRAPTEDDSRVLRAVSRQSLTLAPGQVAGVTGIPGTGMTRIGLSLIAPYADPGPLVYVDARGWANPTCAWEMGIDPDRLLIVRSSDVTSWGRVVASLLDGVRGIYAEIPLGVRDAMLRTLAARARSRRTPVVFRPLGSILPRGIAHVSYEGKGVVWKGTGRGHGALTHRMLEIGTAGKLMGGREGTIEVEDDGTNIVRVVSGMGAAEARRLA